MRVRSVLETVGRTVTWFLLVCRNFTAPFFPRHSAFLYKNKGGRLTLAWTRRVELKRLIERAGTAFELCWLLFVAFRLGARFQGKRNITVVVVVMIGVGGTVQHYTQQLRLLQGTHAPL
jgi:hypothetical protein